jgi:DNA-damage-inducible protein D
VTQLDILATGSAFDAIKRTDERGDYWPARELQPLMEYARWDAFGPVVDKARAALALIQGETTASSNFLYVEKVSGARGPAGRDVRLTRFGAYLTAMAGDDTKRAVAEARIYFAVKTREAETGIARIPAQRRELTNRELAQMVIEEADRADRAEAVAARRTEQLAIAAPKADAWEVLAAATGDMSVREAAFVLNRDANISTGQNRLFNTLKDLGWIDKRRVPYASHEKHVRLRVYTYEDRDTGESHTAQQVRVTAEGLRLLHKRLGGAEPLSHLMPLDPPAA